MTYPLGLIPALPLLGFLLNGLVALATGILRARKESAAWRAAHAHGGHGDEDETIVPEDDQDATDPVGSAIQDAVVRVQSGEAITPLHPAGSTHPAESAHAAHGGDGGRLPYV